MNKPIDLPDYHPIAKILHWAVVLLFIVQYGVAWTMPEIDRNTQPETLISLHLSFGALIILIMLLRLGWRLSHPVSVLSVGVPVWQVIAARATHLALYLLLLVMPLFGWINANDRDWPVTLFGIVPLPRLIAAHTSLGHLAGDVHAVLANVVLGLIGLHVAGALYHHFLLRDGTLARMLPR